MAWFTVYAPRLVHASPEGQPSKSVTETSDILPQGKVIHALSFWAYQTNNRDPIMLSPCAMMGHLYQFCLGFQRLQIRQVKSCLGTHHWNVRTFNDSPRTNVQWKVRVSVGDKNSNQIHPVVSFKSCSNESPKRNGSQSSACICPIAVPFGRKNSIQKPCHAASSWHNIYFL